MLKNKVNKFPKSLCYAKLTNVTKMTQFLLQYNTDIDTRNEHNFTTLCSALSSINTEVAQVLLQHNAGY